MPGKWYKYLKILVVVMNYNKALNKILCDINLYWLSSEKSWIVARDIMNMETPLSVYDWIDTGK